MKKVMAAALLLCLALTACSSTPKESESPTPSPSSPASTAYELTLADDVMASGAFSEELEELEQDMAVTLYGVDGNALEAVKAYHSSGASAEEVAVFRFLDEHGASEAKPALELYLSDRVESYADYLPGEVPKLESAICEQKGNTILLLVADDLEAAQTVLGQ